MNHINTVVYLMSAKKLNPKSSSLFLRRPVPTPTPVKIHSAVAKSTLLHFQLKTRLPCRQIIRVLHRFWIGAKCGGGASGGPIPKSYRYASWSKPIPYFFLLRRFRDTQKRDYVRTFSRTILFITFLHRRHIPSGHPALSGTLRPHQLQMTLNFHSGTLSSTDPLCSISLN